MTKTYLNEAGTFSAKVDKLPEGGSYFWVAETGTDAIRIPLVVETEQGTRSIYWLGWCSDKSFDRTVQTLTKAFGFNGDLVALQAGKTSFEDMDCEIVTEIETYEGKTRCKVKWLNPVGGGRSAPDADRINSIVNRLQARSKAIAKDTLMQSPAKESPAPTPTKKDDIPC